jgi:hypothetical protein
MTALSLDNGIGNIMGGSSYTWNPTVPGTSAVTTVYTLLATNTVAGVSVVRTAQVSVTVNPDPTVPRIAFTATDPTIGVGGSTSLAWVVTNAVGGVAVTLDGTTVSSGTTQTVWPGSTHTYTLVATNTLDASKSASAQVTVTVVPKPTVVLTIQGPGGSPGNQATFNTGQTATLAWTVSDGGFATTQSITAIGGIGTTGSASVSPTVDTPYTLTATNAYGGSTQVTVNSYVRLLPVITAFSASSPSIQAGGNTTLSWTSQGATAITLNGIA